MQKINWAVVSAESFLSEDAIQLVRDEIAQVEKLKMTQGTVDRVITNLSETRNVLLQQVEDAMNQGAIEEKECPFCGAPYDERKILEGKISAEGEKLLALSDGAAEDIQNRMDELYERYFNNMTTEIQSGLQDSLLEEVYKKYQEAKKFKSNLNDIKSLLQKIDINLPEVYQEDITEIFKGYDIFIKNIEQNLKSVPEEIEEQLTAKKFETNYDKYYGRDEEMFRNIIGSVLQIKKEYVKNVILIPTENK